MGNRILSSIKVVSETEGSRHLSKWGQMAAFVNFRNMVLLSDERFWDIIFF